MKHILIDAIAAEIPYFEHLYNDHDFNFALQYGNGPFYLISTDDVKFYEIAFSQKGARELNYIEAQIEFQKMNGYSVVGNLNLIRNI